MTLQLKIRDNGFDSSEPNSCSIIGCKEELNGLYYMILEIDSLEVMLSLCEEHHEQIMKQIDESSDAQQKVLLEWSFEFNEDDPDSIVSRKEVFDTYQELEARLKELEDEFGGVGGVNYTFGLANKVETFEWQFIEKEKRCDA